MATEAAGEEVPWDSASMQYAILAENQRKKRALADTKTKYNILAEENKKLLQEKEETQKETYEVTEYLRRELLLKGEQVARMESLMKEIQEKHEAEIAAAREEAKAKIAKVYAEVAEHERAFRLQIGDLEEKLQGVIEYSRRKDEVEAELADIRSSKVSMSEAMARQKNELERNFVEQTSRMKREYEAALAEHKRAAEEDIDERLDGMTKRIMSQNSQMSHELKLHVEQTDELQGEVRLLEEERRRLQREVSLKTDLEKGFAKRGAAQSQQLKEAETKVAALEATLQGVVRDMDRQRQEIVRRANARLEDGAAEGEGLRRLVKLKSREIRNIRRLAQDVLMQRSDVETFLISSLHAVRKQIEHREAEKAEAGSQQPSDQGGGSDSNPADIRNLSWEDREKVLRLLFAKISNQAEQVNFTSKLCKSADRAGLKGSTSEAGPTQPT